MLTKKSFKITPENYYLDVADCPLKNWRECYEKGYHSIRKHSTYGNEKSDYDAYDILYRSFVERIGQQEEFETYLNNMSSYILAVAKYLDSEKNIDGVKIRDRSKRDRIHLLKSKLERFEKSGDNKGVSIAKMLNRMSKMQGVYLKESDFTVLSYFELIKDYNQWVKS